MTEDDWRWHMYDTVSSHRVKIFVVMKLFTGERL